MSDDRISTSNDVYWRYEVPPNPNETMLLLTSFGHVLTKGVWTGEYGEFYIGYSPMIKRDKDKERDLGLI